MLDSFLLDARYSLRGLRRNPVLSISVVITLVFGIGLNAGSFAVVAGMVFRPRIAKDPVSFFQALPPSSGPFSSTAAEFITIRDRARTVTNVSAWTTSGMRMNGDPRASLIQLVSCGFFDLYGLERAKLGRLLQAADCGGPRVAVITEEIWRDRFHADPGVIGSAVWLAGKPFTVIGVAQAGFAGRLRGSGIWIAYTAVDEGPRPWLTIEGRVAPGNSREEASRELSTLAGRPMTLTNGSLIEMPAARQAALWVTPLVMGALTLLLLLACTNVTVLLLSRAAARRYEMGVRLALGAGRGRLLRMAATEGVLLAAIAGVASAFVAGLVPAGLRAIIPQMPHYPMNIDWVVFAYLAAVTLAAGCIAGLAPAAESLRVDLNSSLKRERTRWKMRDFLIAAQVAVSLVLLVGAALFSRTQLRVLAGGQTEAARHTIRVPIARTDFERVAVRVRELPDMRSVDIGPRGDLLAHFEGDSSAVDREIRAILAGLGVEPRDLPETLESLSTEMSGRFRTVAGVALFLGVAALLLAVIGIYGVIAFSVRLRIKEIGVRIALGATRADIVRSVFQSVVRPVVAGFAVGFPLAIVGAISLAQALRNAPAPMVPMDPVSFAAAAVLVVGASAAAMLRPALRAAKWDPMQSLRQD
jgi:ABC-type antimicrobial peptide transport system permease subunit